MAIKKLCQAAMLTLIAIAPAFAQENPFGQTFQINTRLNSFTGKPSWLIIITDLQTSQVVPYLINITENDSFSVDFTFAHSYRISVSELQFGPPEGSIHNFCHLQGTYHNQSIVINLTGDLTIDQGTSECHVMSYKEYSFPITNTGNDSADTSNSTVESSVAQGSSEDLQNPVAALQSLAAPAANVLNASK